MHISDFTIFHRSINNHPEYMSKIVTAVAHSNIALAKYWGKRDERLNLPAVGSISLTLKALSTTTAVAFNPKLKSDHLVLNDEQADRKKTGRVSRFLDIIRKRGGLSLCAEVRSSNNFPTGAGLASSASAFAALAYAATAAAGLHTDKKELSLLARQGSGSAARSIFGGFVEMQRGSRGDGRDAFSLQIADPSFWDVRMVVAVTDTGEKKVASSEGMKNTAITSPYYRAWIEASDSDIREMRTAILKKDIEKVGELTEYSCLKLHALMMSGRPALIYWNRTTVELLHFVKELRSKGLPAWYTIDAGPQVKVLTLPEYEVGLMKKLTDVNGVRSVIVSSPGPDACIQKEEDAD
jgi:diphosphomevalonate decarboxylase